MEALLRQLDYGRTVPSPSRRAQPRLRLTLRPVWADERLGILAGPAVEVLGQMMSQSPAPGEVGLSHEDDRTDGTSSPLRRRNLVQPEDDPVARRDYRLHMQMLECLRGLYGQDHVSLHAGELTAGVAPEEDLRFHIRDAVLTGQAERIGHGVDIAGEDGAGDLLRTMAQRHVLVEIAFTSNDQILGVSGDYHPFTLYRRSGVPVTLVTDDEGVSRSDLTAQYQQAATTYALSYRELKTMARAAVQHGFLRGADLWRAPDDFRPVSACAADRLGQARPRPSCGALLRSSPKATAEWCPEAGFDRFERQYGG